MTTTQSARRAPNTTGDDLNLYSVNRRLFSGRYKVEGIMANDAKQALAASICRRTESARAVNVADENDSADYSQASLFDLLEEMGTHNQEKGTVHDG